MNDSTRSVGNFGEKVVCNYLKKNGYNILERNYLTRHGEIDIIAEDEQFIVFIEVKTRSETEFLLKYGNPRQAVNRVKWQHIIYAANTYINKFKHKKMPRLDIVEVYITPHENGFISARINHIKSAYRR